MNLDLAELGLPIRIRPERMVTDDELQRFCQENEPLRVERDSTGELIVMSPNWTEGGGLEGEVGRHLGNWAEADGRGKYFGATAGFTLADTSVRAADAAWVSLGRWHALTQEQRRKYARFARSLSSRFDLRRTGSRHCARRWKSGLRMGRNWLG